MSRGRGSKRPPFETLVHWAWLRNISPLKSCLCAVPDMEHVHSLLLLHDWGDHDSVDGAVDVRPGAVKQVSQVVTFRGHGSSVRFFFKAQNCLAEPAIPFPRSIGVVGI